MEIKSTTVTKVIFDNYGSRRFFSTEVATSYYSQSFPAFAFPTGEEDNLKNQFTKIFNVDVFNEENHFPAYVIEDGQFIWGLSNSNGEIFSPHSIYLNDEQLSDKIISNYSSLEKDFPGITSCISREDKINAVVAFYLLEHGENNMVEVCQRYYRNLLLKDDLLKNLDDTNIQKSRTKI